jgi:DnaJ-domain-containing protein 1
VRHQLRHELVRRSFGVARPTLGQDSYQDFAQQQEPPQQPPQEPPPPQKAEPLDVVKVDSLKQAFAILEIPPGRTTLSAAKRAYHRRMAEYHPDKVSALGRELQSMAARKALAINLAWEFIQEHCEAS